MSLSACIVPQLDTTVTLSLLSRGSQVSLLTVPTWRKLPCALYLPLFVFQTVPQCLSHWGDMRMTEVLIKGSLRETCENPMVLIGCLGTAAALLYGLYCLHCGQSHLSQVIKCTWIASQGVRVVTILLVLAASAMKPRLLSIWLGLKSSVEIIIKPRSNKQPCQTYSLYFWQYPAVVWVRKWPIFVTDLCPYLKSQVHFNWVAH